MLHIGLVRQKAEAVRPPKGFMSCSLLETNKTALIHRVDARRTAKPHNGKGTRTEEGRRN